MTANPAVRSDADLDAVVAQVSRSVLTAGEEGYRPFPFEIESCARDAVVDLWDGPIKAFVPLLAARRVRCCLRAGTCACGEC